MPCPESCPEQQGPSPGGLPQQASRPRLGLNLSRKTPEDPSRRVQWCSRHAEYDGAGSRKPGISRVNPFQHSALLAQSHIRDMQQIDPEGVAHDATAICGMFGGASPMTHMNMMIPSVQSQRHLCLQVVTTKRTRRNRDSRLISWNPLILAYSLRKPVAHSLMHHSLKLCEVLPFSDVDIHRSLQELHVLFCHDRHLSDIWLIRMPQSLDFAVEEVGDNRDVHQHPDVCEAR